MTDQIVERVLESARYKDVDRSLLVRIVRQERQRARNTDDAVKRVKRRLHQVVGAFRGQPRTDALAAIRASWNGDMRNPAFRAACTEALRAHASTRERVPHLDSFYTGIWAITGVPRSLLDIGCGLGPLALPWMGVHDARYVATDVDRRPLEAVAAFLELVEQPHAVRMLDAVTELPEEAVDVALLLKLVTTLDRQDPRAVGRVIRNLRAGAAVVTFPTRSLGGRGKGMERSYRERLDRLVAESGRVRAVTEASVTNELVFVLTLDG